MIDAINFDALSPNACARVLELRAAKSGLFRCRECGSRFRGGDEGEFYRGDAAFMHLVSMKDNQHHWCGPIVPLPSPVYVKRRGNGWQVGTQDLPGWALVLG